jgi:translation initiation factor 3 subunit C
MMVYGECHTLPNKSVSIIYSLDLWVSFFDFEEIGPSISFDPGSGCFLARKVMSRFFEAAGSSSESEELLSSDEFVKINETRRGLFESLSYSEEESEEASELSEDESTTSAQPAAPARKSRFMFDSGSDSDEESTTRQVKSQKDKAHDEMEGLAEAIENSLDSHNWMQAQEDYDRMLKLVAKYHGICVPHTAYLVLPTMETELNKYSSDPELKTLNADVAKAYNAMRQKIRKSISKYENEIKYAEKAVNEDEEGSDAESVDLAKAAAEAAPKVTELTPETLLKRLQEIIGTRGRKHVDKHDNVAALRKMIAIAKCRRHVIHSLVALISINLELTSGNLGYIPVEAWAVLLKDLSALIDLLSEEEAAGPLVDLKPEEEDLGLPTMAGIRGSMISYTQRLDDEFTRALQNIDPHSNEYVDFLRVEPELFAFLDKCRLVVLKGKQTEFACNLALRQLEHIYAKPCTVVTKYFSSAASVVEFCRYLYEKAPERQKVRALLFHVYWLAIHDNYIKARDLMLFSHVQESLANFDIATQILYNRSLVQVGLAAFRSGHFKETYFALQELCSTGRPKELLAQGLVGQKYTEKADMDRLERQRLVPFHMQINVELIDCVFLTVSMLLEVPQNAAASRRYFQGERRLFQSRHLRRILDTHDRNLFNGPPENTREYVVAAAKALANGNWRECERHMMTVTIWEQLPNPEAIRMMLKHKIRESGLYSFMYSTGSCYSSLSIERLAKDYDLPMSLVVRIVSRLIGDFGVPASISADKNLIMWAPDCDLTPAQEAIMHLTDKISALEERNNETAELISTLQQSHARNIRNQENIRDQAAAITAQV